MPSTLDVCSSAEHQRPDAFRAREWFEDVTAAGGARVAEAFGLMSDAKRKAWGPCPYCGAERRGSEDRRRPVGLVHGGRGWICYACGAKGDTVGLAAALVTGETKPGRNEWREVRAACADRGLCDPEPGPGVVVRERPRPVAPPSSPPIRPPRAEVLATWNACQPVTNDTSARAWFASRKRVLDVATLADLDLVRVLPVKFRALPWMTCNSHRWTDVYRLVVPMYDHAGELVTLHARAVVPDVRPKGASPSGFEVSGTVMADGLALALLRGEKLATGETIADLVAASCGSIPTADGDTRAGVLIVEGVPDFVAAVCSWSEAIENAPAVLGVIAGSWSPEIAARVPDGARVVIATDPDKTGERYACMIAETLEDRCELARWTPAEVDHG